MISSVVKKKNQSSIFTDGKKFCVFILFTIYLQLLQYNLTTIEARYKHEYNMVRYNNKQNLKYKLSLCFCLPTHIRL